jgi:hypothetical protein
MDRKLDLDDLLARASRDMDFRSGESWLVWQRAKEKRAGGSRRRLLRWAIPLAACALLAARATLPPVRETPRPPILPMRSAMDERDIASRVRRIQLAYDWVEMDGVGAVINDASYDGQHINVMYSVYNAGKAAAGQNASSLQFSPAGELFVLSGDQRLELGRTAWEQAADGNGGWKGVAQYDAAALTGMTGWVAGDFEIEISNAASTGQGDVRALAGTIKLDFRINLQP